MHTRAAALPFLLCLFASCGGDDSGADPAEPGAARIDARFERVESDAARALRELVDLGHYREARALLDAEGPRLGAEADLIEARLAALTGDPTEVVRAVERARAAAPDDPRVPATMVELSAWAGHLDTARTELDGALRAFGATPELLRARGVLELAQQGGARKGVASIESALRRDRDLPFTARALGQGYLLLAKERLAAGQPTAALEAVRASLSHDPEEVEARRVLADVLASAMHFEEAILVMGELVDAGEPLTGELATLHKKAGIAGLIPGEDETAEQRDERRARSLEHFIAARDLGLSDDELGSGARMLEDEAARRTDLAAEAYAAEDLATAKAELELALHHDPTDLAARNLLAVTQYRLGDYAEAARHWREVMVVMESERLVPPDPIHLNLARALVRDGDEVGARGTLERWLERNGEDAAYAHQVAATREALDQLRGD